MLGRAGILVGVLALAGCSKPPPVATLTGALMLDGAPFPLPSNAGDVAVVLRGTDADGKPDPFKLYMGVVKPDGSFEVLSSGGKIEPGDYSWSIDAAARTVPELKPFTVDPPPGKITLVPGPNRLAIELKK